MYVCVCILKREAVERAEALSLGYIDSLDTGFSTREFFNFSHTHTVLFVFSCLARWKFQFGLVVVFKGRDFRCKR